LVDVGFKIYRYEYGYEYEYEYKYKYEIKIRYVHQNWMRSCISGP